VDILGIPIKNQEGEDLPDDQNLQLEQECKQLQSALAAADKSGDDFNTLLMRQILVAIRQPDVRHRAKNQFWSKMKPLGASHQLVTISRLTTLRSCEPRTEEELAEEARMCLEEAERLVEEAASAVAAEAAKQAELEAEEAAKEAKRLAKKAVLLQQKRSREAVGKVLEDKSVLKELVGQMRSCKKEVSSVVTCSQVRHVFFISVLMYICKHP
jgi:membrane protein involved in colicin uptake